MRMVVERLLLMSYLMGMLTFGVRVSPNTSASMRTSFSVPTTRRGSLMLTGWVVEQAAAMKSRGIREEARLTG